MPKYSEKSQMKLLILFFLNSHLCSAFAFSRIYKYEMEELFCDFHTPCSQTPLALYNNLPVHLLDSNPDLIAAEEDLDKYNSELIKASLEIEYTSFSQNYFARNVLGQSRKGK